MNQFDQIIDLDEVFVSSSFDSIPEHGDILRAGNNEFSYFTQFHRFTNTGFTRAFFNITFRHPDAPATCAAAERPIIMARHLD